MKGKLGSGKISKVQVKFIFRLLWMTNPIVIGGNRWISHTYLRPILTFIVHQICNISPHRMEFDTSDQIKKTAGLLISNYTKIGSEIDIAPYKLFIWVGISVPHSRNMNLITTIFIKRYQRELKNTFTKIYRDRFGLRYSSIYIFLWL